MEEAQIGGSCIEQEIDGVASYRENHAGLLWGYDGDRSQDGWPRAPSVLTTWLEV